MVKMINVVKIMNDTKNASCLIETVENVMKNMQKVRNLHDRKINILVVHQSKYETKLCNVHDALY